MVKSMFAAVSGLQSHQSKLDVIGNNISNVNTWGYKSRTTNFQDAMYQNTISSTAGGTGGGTYGGINSSQLGYGTYVSSVATNFSTGGRAFTGFGLNAMINGSGFFIVGPKIDNVGATPGSAPDGVPDSFAAENVADSGVSLSRVGIFSVDGDGYLVDGTGNHVYGYQPVPTAVLSDPELPFDATTNPYESISWQIPDPPGQLAPIRIPMASTVDPATGTITPGTLPYDLQAYSIDQDGTVRAVTVDDNREIVIGQLATVTVANTNGLVQTEGYLYEFGPNVGQVSVGVPASGARGPIISNNLEMSNTDLAVQLTDMITTQRGYQANSKIITVTDEMLEVLVNMKR